MGLWYQSAYSDEEDEPTYVTTPKRDGERPGETLERHAEEYDDEVDTFPIGTGAAPAIQLPAGVTIPPALVDSYVDALGVRRSTIVTPDAGETPAQTEARFNAAKAAMRAKYPAA